MRVRLIFAFAIALSTGLQLSAQEQAVSIFNGQDYSGWHGNNPHTTAKAKDREASLEKQAAEFANHWSVEAGEMVNDGKGPYATTDKEYGDVELELQYKTVAKGDSGIYMKSTPQIQIWDYTEEGGKWKLGADKGSGGLWNNSKGAPGKDPLVLADKPFGEWNHVKTRLLGSRTWVWLNDKLVVDGVVWENYWDRSKPLPPTGPIHLQTHGAEIRWKDITAREIPADEANQLLRADDAEQGFTSIFDGKSLSGWAGATDNYEVVDGAIQCIKGKGGTLYHEKELADFAVRLEFKLPPGGNNGLAIRYPGHGNSAYIAMTELQVLDNTAKKYAKLDKRQYHGSAYGMAAAHRGYLRPVGQWNTQEVTVVGSTITVELNGSIILKTDLADITSYMQDRQHPGKLRETGFFGFAGHSDPVAFKNIAIKEL